MKLRDYQIDIVERTRIAFRTYKRPLVVLPCGSGKTVCFADMASRHIARSPQTAYVWFLVHRRELIEQTQRTFDAFGISREHVFIGMVQTITRHPERYAKPTLIIFDEAHHAKAKSWTDIIEYFDGTPMVGLTATPARQDGRPLGDIFDTLVIGPDADTLTERGWLAEYDYYAPHSTDLTYRVRGADFDLTEFADVLLRSKIYGDIKKYIHPDRKTLIYSPSVAFSRSLASLGVTHFDGETPTAERERIISQFRSGKIMALSSVDLVGEGFDIPDCDTVLLLRPTRSLALYIQQAMRCLRPSVGKRAVIYDLVGNVYRHGMPTESRDWSLTTSARVRNESGEPDITARECSRCHRVYAGTERICPYCGNDSGKTRKQIEQDEAAELVQVKKIERRQQSRAQTLDELIAIGRQRGYKNPEYWARIVIASRRKKI